MKETAALAFDMVDPEPVRFLDEAGTYAPSQTAAAFAAELDTVAEEDYLQWYRDMVSTRSFDTECTHLQRQGKLALWAPSVGQEGCQVGVAHAAQPQDHLFPSYREHLVARVRGVDAVDIAKQFQGMSHGGWDITDPKNGNTHLYTLVLGAQTQHATGYALGQVLDAKRRAQLNTLEPGEAGTETGDATIVFYGDGTTSQGDANESLIFAASYQTPQLFVMQNNQWAISVPVTRQSRTPLYRRALGMGIRSVQIDGNDPLASFAVSSAYLRAAREGHGPGYIEALTYRVGPHTTSDDPLRYRDPAELESWEAKDPIVRFGRYLREQGVAESFFAETAEAAATEAHTIREQILQLTPPTRDSMFANVYQEPHPRVDEQQAWLDRYEASFSEGGH